MVDFLRIDINLVAMSMLFMVFIIAIKRLDQKDILNRAYLVTLVVVAIQLFIEALTCLINGKSQIEYRILSHVLHVLLYGIAPILSSSWFLLVRHFVTGRRKSTQKELVFIFIPVILNAVFSILSPWFGYLFSIDQLGVYTRGPLFIVSLLITYAYFIMSLVHIMINREKLLLNELILLATFNIIPILGAILQGLFYGVLLAWSSAGFSLVIVYIYLQERLVHLDVMTGVWTRRSFDYYMDKRLKQKNVSPFGGIYFDIDHLKTINDRFGHAEGDIAIIEVISRIKGLIKSGEIIARLGGDEFIIITNDSDVERLKSLIKDIQLSLSIYNEHTKKDYVLSCSFGYGVYSTVFKTMDQYLRFIDHQMYQSKHVSESQV